MSVRQLESVRTTGISVLGLVVAVLGWWAVTAVFNPPSYILPPPDSVASRLLANPDLYLANAGITTQKILLGGSIGAGLGIILGSLIAHVGVLRRALLPYLVTLRVLPKIAIAPVLLLYVGLGLETAILFVAIIAFFPVVISTAAGFERLPERHAALLESVDAGRLPVFLHVSVPFALPDIFAGLKQAAALAVIGAIVAEWIVSTSGLGYLILVASENVQTSVLLAALVLLLVVGLLVYGSVVVVQWAVLGSATRYSRPA